MIEAPVSSGQRAKWISSRARSFSVLPFRFMALDNERYLAVSAGGEFVISDRPTIASLIDGSFRWDHPQSDDLEARHFITSGNPQAALSRVASQIKTRLSDLPEFTALHIFVVTLRCDHTCQYCQVSRVSQNRTAFDLSREHARLALEHVFRSPSRLLKIEFQGGEPLLNWKLIQWIEEEAELRKGDREVQYVIATHLGLLTDEILDYCRAYPIFFSTSLDGPAALHDANRPKGGSSSHAQVVSNIERVRSSLGEDRVSALMTTTAASLSQPEAIVDEYVRLDFDSIFLRPLSDYGFASRAQGRICYQESAFLDFYKRALRRILEWNAKGVHLVEVYSQLLLRRILTPFPTGFVDLQSPSGIGIAAMVYNYNGKVYAADEGRMLAEMGDDRFCLGAVSDSYESLFLGNDLVPLLEETMLEAIPQCSDCALNLYCGTDPVYHYRAQSDPVGHRPTSGFCQRNMEIIKHLILILDGDPAQRRLLYSWLS